MLWKLLVALWALVLLTLITVTISSAGTVVPARGNGTQHQVAKPKFEDIKLQTGMGRKAAAVVRGSG